MKKTQICVILMLVSCSIYAGWLDKVTNKVTTGIKNNISNETHNINLKKTKKINSEETKKEDIISSFKVQAKEAWQSIDKNKNFTDRYKEYYKIIKKMKYTYFREEMRRIRKLKSRSKRAKAEQELKEKIPIIKLFIKNNLKELKEQNEKEIVLAKNENEKKLACFIFD